MNILRSQDPGHCCAYSYVGLSTVIMATSTENVESRTLDERADKLAGAISRDVLPVAKRLLAEGLISESECSSACQEQNNGYTRAKILVSQVMSRVLLNHIFFWKFWENLLIVKMWSVMFEQYTPRISWRKAWPLQWRRMTKIIWSLLQVKNKYCVGVVR